MRPRLLLQLVRLEASKLMSYRGDFWITAVANLGAVLVVNYFLLSSIFATTGKETIAGYSFPGMLTYLIAVSLIGPVVRGSDLQMGIASEIYDGGLSRYFLYPTRYLPFKYAQHVGSILPLVVQMAIFTTILIVTIGLPADSALSARSILAALPALAVANLLYFLLSAPIQCVAFWADNVWSLGVMLRFASMFLGGAMLPLDVFSPAVQEFLRWLPFVACYEFPVLVAMGEITDPGDYFSRLALGLGWCALVAAACRPVWKRGQLGYTGVGI